MNMISGFMQVVNEPIEVNGDKVKVDPSLMEVDRPYRFVWGGVEVFAVKRVKTPSSTLTGSNGYQTWVYQNTAVEYTVEFYAKMPNDTIGGPPRASG